MLPFIYHIRKDCGLVETEKTPKDVSMSVSLVSHRIHVRYIHIYIYTKTYIYHTNQPNLVNILYMDPMCMGVSFEMKTFPRMEYNRNSKCFMFDCWIWDVIVIIINIVIIIQTMGLDMIEETITVSRHPTELRFQEMFWKPGTTLILLQIGSWPTESLVAFSLISL